MKFIAPFFLLQLSLCVSYAQWTPQSSGTDAHFRSISAVNEKIVWAGGSKGTVLHTVNGGTTWEVLHVQGAEKLDFRGIHGLDAQTAVAVSAGLAEEGQARIFRTNDGGKTWKEVWQTTEKGVFLDGISFWDAKNGLIFGDPIGTKIYLLKTADGGQTWQRISPSQLPENKAGEAAFAASNSTMVLQGKKNVWIGTGGSDHARVFYSTDRGTTWQVTDTPMAANASSGIFGLNFWDAKNGIAVGGNYKADKDASDNVIVTHDGGQTWQKATPTQPAGLKEAVRKLKNGYLVAVGPAGTSLSKDNGQTWQALTNAPVGLHAMTCVGNACWAIGAKSALVYLRFP
ncbi:MAG TPA: oxidoreductase [Runella sp.]|nr:oxidoreductase [Runella sp.]